MDIRTAYVIWCVVGTTLLMEGLGWFIGWGQRTFEGWRFYAFAGALGAVIFFIGWLLDRSDRRAAASALPRDQASPARLPD